MVSKIKEMGLPVYESTDFVFFDKNDNLCAIFNVYDALLVFLSSFGNL
jgi:hypothetical protein